jgi:hypothetical protein
MNERPLPRYRHPKADRRLSTKRLTRVADPFLARGGKVRAPFDFLDRQQLQRLPPRDRMLDPDQGGGPRVLPLEGGCARLQS